MSKKKKKPVSDAPKWSVCQIEGCTVACDPGCNTITPYPKEYTPEQIEKGMVLTDYCSYLPKVKVMEVGENYLVLKSGELKQTIFTGDYYCSPRRPLDYAYAEAEIWLK